MRARSPLSWLLVAAAALTLLGAGPAQAAGAGYRYWSFWQGDGAAWTYATEGPATARPEDGSVNGFRFSVSADSADSTRPRRAPDFADVCGTTPAEPGAKRVALVIDPGLPEDAPDGENPPPQRTACARVADSATTADALASVAKPLRYNGQALLCAISGYPATGCGEQVSAAAGKTAPAEPDSASDSDGGPSLGAIAGVSAIALLALAALLQSRRRPR
ncbi:SCO2322 family protein [Streptomyces sp. NPDC014894]|uniref:SCO2322 family protein n=1 Tax=Streptomyces sp. NPDC014894 TaxID=3364931 RepID=UPI0036F98B94